MTASIALRPCPVPKYEGQIDDATGKKMAPRYSHVLEVFVKQHGVWLISDMMIMDEYLRQ